jgi:hypothetical protein
MEYTLLLCKDLRIPILFALNNIRSIIKKNNSQIDNEYYIAFSYH